MLKPERILSYFLIPAFFFLFHVLLDLVFNVYGKFPWFSSVMHFAGGMMLALTFFLLLNYLNKKDILNPASS
jgi:mannose/fructose/N-acetylgalactosamine-specific phosphotransferase system component IIC